jgi:hypothetical protein
VGFACRCASSRWRFSSVRLRDAVPMIKRRPVNSPARLSQVPSEIAAMSQMHDFGPFLTGKSLFLRLQTDAARTCSDAQYAPIIEGFARKMVTRSHDVADLVQEAEWPTSC